VSVYLTKPTLDSLFPHDVRNVDDGYIKTKLNVSLQVLAEVKCVLKEDTGLDLNVSKTSVLPKGTTQQTVFDVSHNIINVSHTLTHLHGDVSLVSFCPEGFVGIGVSTVSQVLSRQHVCFCLEIQVRRVERESYLRYTGPHRHSY
jgi:hypothetical protein